MKLSSLSNKFKHVVMIIYDENDNILIGKATNDDDRNGKMCLPAGTIEPNETPQNAATRECLEETGITSKVNGEITPPSKSTAYIISLQKVGGSLNPNDEFETLKWMPINKILKLDDLYHKTKDILSYLKNKNQTNQ